MAAPASSASSTSTPYAAYGVLDNAKFNPTMAIIIVVLIAAFVFLAFFSGYLKRCIVGESAELPTTRRGGRTGGQTATKAHGLDQETVDALPIVHYKDLGEKEDRECPVCLAAFDADESLRLLPTCNHVFHLDCIDVWFRLHSTCPLCRASLLPASLEDDSNDGDSDAARRDDGDDDQAGTGAPANAEDDVVGDSVMSQTRGDGAPSGEGSVTSAGAPVTREGERDSACSALLRNSQSFKRAVRVVTGHGHDGKPAAAEAAPIRRANSVGTDLKSIRGYFVDSEGTQHNGIYGNGAMRVLRPELAEEAAQLNGFALVRPDEHWVTIDLEGGGPGDAGPSTRGSATPKSPPAAGGPGRVWSERWSFSALRGAVFPLRRTTSEVSLQTQIAPN